jgi:Uma2 family endonuclease
MTTVTTTPPRQSPATALDSAGPGPFNEEVLYEIVDNEFRELPPRSAREIHLASTLFRMLSNFAWNHELGHVESEMLFLLNPLKNLQRRPDLAFVTFERWPRNQRIPSEPAWKVVPNLVIEIISPKNFAHDVMQRIEDYFEAGVQRVWVIYPNTSKVYDYDSPSAIRILSPEQSIDGGTLLQGFQVPLKDLLDNGTEQD